MFRILRVGRISRVLGLLGDLARVHAVVGIDVVARDAAWLLFCLLRWLAVLMDGGKEMR